MLSTLSVAEVVSEQSLGSDKVGNVRHETGESGFAGYVNTRSFLNLTGRFCIHTTRQ